MALCGPKKVYAFRKKEADSAHWLAVEGQMALHLANSLY